MKWQILALTVTAVFGGAIAWIKAHGGKISAWIRVVGSVCNFGTHLNDTCADGKATPEEVQQLVQDYNKLLTDLGLAKAAKIAPVK